MGRPGNLECGLIHNALLLLRLLNMEREGPLYLCSRTKRLSLEQELVALYVQYSTGQQEEDLVL